MMSELNFLHHYTEAAKESTDRTRKILLIMIVASILVLTAYWNTRSGGWVNSRLAIAKATDDLLRSREGEYPRSEIVPPAGEQELYGKADYFRKRYPAKTPYQAKENLFWIQKIRAEQVSQVQVPVLGISFDVNDLGLLGGVTFTVLLIWVNYSLWHHSNNLNSTFILARRLENTNPDLKASRLLYHTYQNLAMRQVLTIPPRPRTLKANAADSKTNGQTKNDAADAHGAQDKDPDSKTAVVNDKPAFTVRLSRLGSKILYALPLVAQAAVVFSDWRTRDVGFMINTRGTYIVLATGTTFLIFIVILTVICADRWRQTYAIWRSVAEDI